MSYTCNGGKNNVMVRKIKVHCQSINGAKSSLTCNFLLASQTALTNTYTHNLIMKYTCYGGKINVMVRKLKCIVN